MTMKMTMVTVIGCTLFHRFCKHFRASSNEMRPILAQSQRMSSRVIGRHRAARQHHSFAARVDPWPLLRSFLPHPMHALAAHTSLQNKPPFPWLFHSVAARI